MQRRIGHAHGRADRLVHGRARARAGVRARSLADVIRDHNDRRTAD